MQEKKGLVKTNVKVGLLVQGGTLSPARSINRKQLTQHVQLDVGNTHEKTSSKKQASYVSEAEGRCLLRPMLFVVVRPVEVLASVTCVTSTGPTRQRSHVSDQRNALQGGRVKVGRGATSAPLKT